MKTAMMMKMMMKMKSMVRTFKTNCMANKTVFFHVMIVISIHPCNVSEELASSEDEIDEEGAQYIEKLEKAVSSS